MRECYRPARRRKRTVAPGAPYADPAETEAIQRAHVERVGADAYLLERMAAERQAYGEDATGIDPDEAVQAVADARELRTLAIRHAAQHARANALPRAQRPGAEAG